MKEIDDFLLHAQACNKSPHTIRSYKAALEAFARTAAVPLSEIGPDAIERFLGLLYSRGVSKTTRAQRLAAIKSWFKWMEREGIVHDNFADAFQGPRCPSRRMRVPTQQETRSLCEGPFDTAFPERDRLLVELLYGSGIREDEAVSIDLADITGNRLRVHGKGLKQRVVFLTDYAQRDLAEYLPLRERRLGSVSTPALFFGLRVGLRGQASERLTTRSVGRIIKQLGIAHGLPWLSPHSLRRAFATHLHEASMSHFHIFRLLGHARLSTTERYIAQSSRKRLLEAYNRGRGAGADVDSATRE